MSDYGSPPPPPPLPEEGDPSGHMPPMPSGPPPAPASAVRPPAMDQAVMLMKVGAGLSLVGLLFTFVMRGALRDAVEKASANSATHLTATQIDAAVAFAFGAAIVSGLVGAGLWWWMASANGQGKKWARLVATVLFALNLLGFLGSLVQAQPVASRLWALLLVLLGGYVIVLLYKKQSTAYYDAQSAPRL